MSGGGGQANTYWQHSLSAYYKKTFTAHTALAGFTPAATPTDIWRIRNPGGVLIRVNRVRVYGVATAASWIQQFLLKYITLGTWGSVTAVSIIPHLTTDVPVGVVEVATANPTVGTLAGTGTATGLVDSDVLALQAATLATSGDTHPLTLVYDYGVRNGQAIRLAINEYLALNWNGVAVPAGAKLWIKAEWTEE